MIDFTFFGIIIFTIIFIINIINLIKNKKKFIVFVRNIIFAIYILLLIAVVFFPIPVQDKMLEILKEENPGYKYNFIPFKSIIYILKSNDFYNSLIQIGGNLCLLIPLGIYVPLVWTKFKKIGLFLLLMFFTSFFIESIQFILGILINYQYRVVDCDDIILNTIGSLFGFLISLRISPLYKKIIEDSL